jgi:uncharacterized membrane protein YgdD (TMEM256/DUF423 family)
VTPAPHAAPASWIGPCGALAAGVAVALGAFGAHALADVLSDARAATFETAVRYQLVHGVALLALDAGRTAGTIAERHARQVAAALSGGILLFSGALYALVATDVGAFGAVAPLGGTLLLVGWGLWAWRLIRWRRRGTS